MISIKTSIKFLAVSTIALALIQLGFFDAAFKRRSVLLYCDCGCQKEKALDRDGNESFYIKVLNTMKNILFANNLPTIYVVTATYKRPVQKADLIRLIHTLQLVPEIHWIVVEDAENKTDLVTNLLTRCRFKYTHLNVPSSNETIRYVTNTYSLRHKGLSQRNEALFWMREHLSPNDRGVVYFADDDNTYDTELFKEMRFTQSVSVWPVGLVGGLMVEKPIVKDGKVVSWNALFGRNRTFPVDMAGFAVNLQLLIRHKEIVFNVGVPIGHQESKFLENLVTINDLEPKAHYCTKVLVWHTRTASPNLSLEKKFNVSSDLGIEV